MTAPDIHGAIDAVWRIESARVIATLTRLVGDVGLAEELAQDALVAALERWPEQGIPRNPGAWLTATAKHRAYDALRRDKMLARKHEELGRELEARQESVVPALEDALDDPVGDDLLRLLFIACHPVLSTEARGASNAKAKRELGWTPRHPSWRTGFPAAYSALRVADTPTPRRAARPSHSHG